MHQSWCQDSAILSLTHVRFSEFPLQFVHLIKPSVILIKIYTWVLLVNSKVMQPAC